MRRFGGSARGLLRFRVKGGVFRALSKNGDEIAKVVDGKLQPTKFIEDGVVIKEMPEGVLVRKGEEIGFRGLKTRSLEEILVNGRIPLNGKGFNKWFDNLTLEEFDKIWSNGRLNNTLRRRIRWPGEYHEWCMVCETRKFKEWNVPMSDIQRFRTKTLDLKGVNPNTGKPFAHSIKNADGKIVSGPGSKAFHNELKKLIGKSNSLKDFNEGLAPLLDRWKVDYSLLPPFLIN